MKYVFLFIDILTGSVHLAFNKDLCFNNLINWGQILKRSRDNDTDTLIDGSTTCKSTFLNYY